MESETNNKNFLKILLMVFFGGVLCFIFFSIGKSTASRSVEEVSKQTEGSSNSLLSNIVSEQGYASVYCITDTRLSKAYKENTEKTIYNYFKDTSINKETLKLKRRCLIKNVTDPIFSTGGDFVSSDKKYSLATLFSLETVTGEIRQGLAVTSLEEGSSSVKIYNFTDLKTTFPEYVVFSDADFIYLSAKDVSMEGFCDIMECSSAEEKRYQDQEAYKNVTKPFLLYKVNRNTFEVESVRI